jgi:signal transduction histidine kinase
MHRAMIRGFPLRCVCVIAALLFGQWVLSAPNADQTVVVIDHAQLIDQDAPGVISKLTLPSLTLHEKRHFRWFRLESDFLVRDLGESALWAIYFTSLYDGGTVRVNGVVIGQVETSSLESTVRHARPYLFHLPPNLIRAGANRLQVEWAGRETLTLVSKVFLGPVELITPVYQQRLFWQNEMAQVAFVFALVVALMLLVIFYLRRNQSSYLLLGLSAIGCATVVFVYLLPTMPSWLYPYWRLLHISGIALFTQCAWLFLIRESDPQQIWFQRVSVAWGVLGPFYYLLNFWINDVSFSRPYEGIWGVGAGLIGLYPVALLIRSVWRQLAWRKVVFLAATILAIVVGVSDILLQTTGRSTFGNVGYSLQVVSSLWLSALTAVLMTDFVSSLTEQDRQRKRMAVKLAEQQNALATLHDTDRASARERATLDERNRIMQDIHDGLGSQLITSLALSERGALSPEQTSLLLRESIDDIRLAIDTMSHTEDQFAVAVGNLRFRMEPRLRAAGISLAWDSTGFTESSQLQTAQTLPLLRILQESITNALKHSQATRIAVHLSAKDGFFTMRISDNGKGFERDQIRPGKGLSGMEKRARGLGATLSVSHAPGTVIAVRLPLDNRPEQRGVEAQ